MEKIFLLKGLDCPNCAAKIEKEVGELKGVEKSSVNLMKQTLTVNSEDSFSEDIEKNIKEIVLKYEPEVAVEQWIADNVQNKGEDEEDNKKIIFRFVSGAVLFTIGIIMDILSAPLLVELAFLIAAYIILGGSVVIKAAKNIIKGRIFDENFLMSLSTVGAFFIGEYPEAVAVMLFYQVGEYFQELSVKRSRKSISDLMDIRPDTATVIRNGEFITVEPDSVSVGEKIIVKSGERIPLDGLITDGESTLDTKALTGEAMPKSVKIGDEVLSGCINQGGVLTVEVTKTFGESTASKIIDLVENASSRKAPTENFITAFARFYTPIVVILAAIIAVVPSLLLGGGWNEWIHRGMVFLVISCPCALVISIPLTFFGGIGAASRHGVLIKGSNYLEALNKVSRVVFDKTGTLTKGDFVVADIIPQNGFNKETILEYAAYAESLSNHPIAQSILSAYGKEPAKTDITDFKEISGQGISAICKGKNILAGNSTLLVNNNIEFSVSETVGTKVYIAVDGAYAGCILINDEIKKDSEKAIADLKQIGVEKIIMLTGDDEKISKSVAEKLGVDEYYSRLLPQQKVEKLEQIDIEKRQNSKLVFVGDGINDAPVLARADIGVAMGGIGTDAAIEAADVVLMTDEPSKIVEAIRIAKETKRIVIQNIVISLTIKIAFLILGAFGIAGMWEAVFGDVGVALIAVLNAMRMIKK